MIPIPNTEPLKNLPPFTIAIHSTGTHSLILPQLPMANGTLNILWLTSDKGANVNNTHEARSTKRNNIIPTEIITLPQGNKDKLAYITEKYPNLSTDAIERIKQAIYPKILPSTRR